MTRPPHTLATTANDGQQGDGSPSDTYADDEDLMVEHEDQLSLPDVPGEDDDIDNFDDDDVGAADNDEGEETGGQEMPMAPSVPAKAKEKGGASESWNYRDKPKPKIPPHMYTAPRYRPGGEEGDDTMDAADYYTALNGQDGPGMGGFTDFLKQVGTTVGVDTLNAATRALGGRVAPKQVIVPPKPPMSTAAKVGIAIAVALPVLYFLTRSHPSPAVATNPRRRRRRRR